MQSLLKRLVDCCVSADSKVLVNRLISNESFHYIELNHKKFLKKYVGYRASHSNASICSDRISRRHDKTTIENKDIIYEEKW